MFHISDDHFFNTNALVRNSLYNLFRCQESVIIMRYYFAYFIFQIFIWDQAVNASCITSKESLWTGVSDFLNTFLLYFKLYLKNICNMEHFTAKEVSETYSLFQGSWLILHVSCVFLYTSVIIKVFPVWSIPGLYIACSLPLVECFFKG